MFWATQWFSSFLQQQNSKIDSIEDVRDVKWLFWWITINQICWCLSNAASCTTICIILKKNFNSFLVTCSEITIQLFYCLKYEILLLPFCDARWSAVKQILLASMTFAPFWMSDLIISSSPISILVLQNVHFRLTKIWFSKYTISDECLHLFELTSSRNLFRLKQFQPMNIFTVLLHLKLLYYHSW